MIQKNLNHSPRFYPRLAQISTQSSFKNQCLQAKRPKGHPLTWVLQTILHEIQVPKRLLTQNIRAPEMHDFVKFTP